MDEQRVAVGLCGGRNLTADLSGCTRFGLDDTGLLQDRLEHRGERPADDVGGAAGRERIDEGNRVGRIGVFGESGPHGQGRGCGGATSDKMASVHVNPPWKCLFLPGISPALLLDGMLSPGAVGNQASMIATALVQPAEPPRTFTGKQLTMKPLGGSASRLCSFSIWQ